MDKKLVEYIKEITDASRKGNLVFFVGAGVSRLSDYPSWSELVDRFYKRLYGVEKNENYSSDEFLRIPQIFYDVKGEKEYNKILKDVFDVEKSPNPIHDKILAMSPTHIITTNYDNLLDTVCLKRGEYFSVISSEEDVASAKSSRYLLKVHGDFRRGYKGKNIVLKEEDYLNYEQNFPLISNIMKSIIATHTIVFIGYSLNDYNINLILNWVKKLQKDSFHKPFFVRTDPSPIANENSIYYEKRGLRIIDAVRLIDSKETSYLKRYSTVMDLLIDSKENEWITNDIEVIDFIYDRISPLFFLQYIRKMDLNHVFDFDYHFFEDGRVVRNKNKGFRYMERFFEIRDNNEIINLPKKQYGKFKAITSFFDKNGISCMLEKSNGVINFSLKIENPAFHGKYQEIEKYIKTPSKCIEDDYKKGFFLACLGRLEESYNCYSKVILKSIEDSNWCIHYLSQINRYWIYQTIKQFDKYFNNQGIIIFGKRFKPFSDEFISSIEREMKNFDINNLFSNMPYEFQKKYKILEFLSSNKFLYDDTVKLFELTNKVRSTMIKGSYTFGLSDDIKALLRLYDNLRFLYENYLWFVSYENFHQYVRNTMSLLIEKTDFEKSRDLDEFGSTVRGNGLYFSIDYNDFISIARTFKVDDIKNWEKICSINHIKFTEKEKIEEYIIRIAEKTIKLFSEDSINIVFYNQFISEMKSVLYFAKYIKLSECGFSKIVKAILFYIPERDLDIGKRYVYIKRLTENNGLPLSIIQIIEEYLIAQAEKHSNPEFKEYSSNNLFSSNFGALIKHFEKNFISKKLSEMTLKLTKENKNQVDFLFSLLPLVSTTAKDHLLSLKRIENIHDLINGMKLGLIEEFTSEHEEIIIKYLEKEKLDFLATKGKGIEILKIDYLGTIGILYFLKKLKNPKIKDFIGISNEFDFFVDPKNFDYKNFVPSWLKKYSEALLDEISKNEYMRHHIIEILKEHINNKKDKEYLKILLNHFI